MANDESCEGIIHMPEPVLQFVTDIATRINHDTETRFKDTSVLCSQFITDPHSDEEEEEDEEEEDVVSNKDDSSSCEMSMGDDDDEDSVRSW
jgi:hypothetical protein